MKDHRLLVALFAVWLIAVLFCVFSDANAETYTVRIVQAIGGLNVRSAPDGGAPLRYLLQDTETVLVLDWCNGWALVAKNSGAHTVLGWANAEYLK